VQGMVELVRPLGVVTPVPDRSAVADRHLRNHERIGFVVLYGSVLTLLREREPSRSPVYDRPMRERKRVVVEPAA
jgi:hypothetical protein